MGKKFGFFMGEWFMVAYVFLGAIILSLSVSNYQPKVLAATYTITTTAPQDVRINRLRGYANFTNLPGAPFATNNDFMDYQCKSKLLEIETQLKNSQNDAFNNAWDSLNDTARTNICSSMGLGSTPSCKP